MFNLFILSARRALKLFSICPPFDSHAQFDVTFQSGFSTKPYRTLLHFLRKGISVERCNSKELNEKVARMSIVWQ